MANGVLVIACGALSWELTELQRRNAWGHLRVRCLPPELHNTPDRIPGAVEAAVLEGRETYQQVFVAYADCGTGGMLDRTLAQLGVERLPGAHCYELFTGSPAFAALCEEEPGTFYLTDFLVRHFDRLVIGSLGLDRHPALRQQYFGHYRRVVYLAQTESQELTELAMQHARTLGLEFERYYTGLRHVRSAMTDKVVKWRN
ncbi:MAG TPA: DUF1638 domain-containing protein [Woeseiaceae bacterium]